MIMSVRDICMEHRLAKNKGMQVGILADQNQTSKFGILTILCENGEELDESEKRMLCGILDSIERKINKRERELGMLNAQYKTIADFLKGGMHGGCE